MNTTSNNQVTTFARATAFAALGCVVTLTTPPASNPEPYWTVVVRNATAVYSPRYRLHSESKALALAVKIASERGIEIAWKAAPERPVIHLVA
jgi:hypothetical protein